MSDETPEQAPQEPPGKRRTWWHTLLNAFLRLQLADRFDVRDEMTLGAKPLQADYVLMRKRPGEPDEFYRRFMAGLYERLNERTMVEFKSPQETVRGGDFQTFLAYAMLYRAQECPDLPAASLSLVIIAPHVTEPMRRECAALGLGLESAGTGVVVVRGGVLGHPLTFLETDRLSDAAHPLLTLFSKRLLTDPHEVWEELSAGGYNVMVSYMMQNVLRYRREGTAFLMQHAESETSMREVFREFIEQLTPEERLQGLTAEQRLRGLPPEERLRGIPVEDRFRDLSAEERRRLAELLLRSQPGEPS